MGILAWESYDDQLTVDYISMMSHINDLVEHHELLSKVVFGYLNQAATWSVSFTSTPSLNLIPVTTFAR